MTGSVWVAAVVLLWLPTATAFTGAFNADLTPRSITPEAALSSLPIRFTVTCESADAGNVGQVRIDYAVTADSRWLTANLDRPSDRYSPDCVNRPSQPFDLQLTLGADATAPARAAGRVTVWANMTKERPQFPEAAGSYRVELSVEAATVVDVEYRPWEGLRRGSTGGPMTLSFEARNQGNGPVDITIRFDPPHLAAAMGLSDPPPRRLDSPIRGDFVHEQPHMFSFRGTLPGTPGIHNLTLHVTARSTMPGDNATDEQLLRFAFHVEERSDLAPSLDAGLAVMAVAVGLVLRRRTIRGA